MAETSEECKAALKAAMALIGQKCDVTFSNPDKIGKAGKTKIAGCKTSDCGWQDRCMLASVWIDSDGYCDSLRKKAVVRLERPEEVSHILLTTSLSLPRLPFLEHLC